MIPLSDELAKEMVEQSRSKELKKDMEIVASSSRDAFLKDGEVDIDGYIEFLNFFNEFVNHRPNPREAFIEKIMKL